MTIGCSGRTPRVRRMAGVAAASVLAVATGAAWALPDLVVDEATLASSVITELQRFAPDACELKPADLCLGAPGGRKVLRFSVLAANQGDEDLVVGDPTLDPDAKLPNGDPKWVFSQCHNHFHFQTFARYELRRRGEAAAVLTGQKRSFCVEDTRRVTATSSPLYCCNPGPACESPLQGIQVGWGDLYPSNLPCQWIDITDGPTAGSDLAPGEYDVCVFLNTGGFLGESSLDNNSRCVPVTVDAPQAKAPRVKLVRPTPRTPLRVGSTVKVGWKKKLRGAFQLRELWFSKDGGATWTLVSTSTNRGETAFPWAVPADAATDQGKLRVVVWQRFPRDGVTPGSFQRGIAESRTLRIEP